MWKVTSSPSKQSLTEEKNEVCSFIFYFPVHTDKSEKVFYEI